MKTKFFFLVVTVLFFFNPSNSLENNNDKIVIEISKNIRCLICQGQSIYDSQSDFAISMKLVIKKKLEEGMNEDDIYKSLKDKYGNWIVYEPEFSKNTLILWIMPILLFLFGGVIIFKKIKYKKKF